MTAHTTLQLAGAECGDEDPPDMASTDLEGEDEDLGMDNASEESVAETESQSAEKRSNDQERRYRQTRTRTVKPPQRLMLVTSTSLPVSLGTSSFEAPGFVGD